MNEGDKTGLTEAERSEIVGAIPWDGDYSDLWEVVSRIKATAAEEALTGALHPEFGYEWREPNGVVYKAWAQGKAEGAAAQTKDLDEVRFLLRGELPKQNNLSGRDVLVTVYGDGEGELAIRDPWDRWGPPQKLNPAN